MDDGARGDGGRGGEGASHDRFAAHAEWDGVLRWGGDVDAEHGDVHEAHDGLAWLDDFARLDDDFVDDAIDGCAEGEGIEACLGLLELEDGFLAALDKELVGEAGALGFELGLAELHVGAGAALVHGVPAFFFELGEVPLGFAGLFFERARGAEAQELNFGFGFAGFELQERVALLHGGAGLGEERGNATGDGEGEGEVLAGAGDCAEAWVGGLGGGGLGGGLRAWSWRGGLCCERNPNSTRKEDGREEGGARGAVPKCALGWESGVDRLGDLAAHVHNIRRTTL